MLHADSPPEQLLAHIRRLEAQLARCEAERAALEAALGSAQAELLGQRRRLAIYAQIPAGVYDAPLEHSARELFISDHVERLVGYTAQEWSADPDLWARLLHPDDRERVLADVRRSRAAGERLACEYRIRHRDGRWLWIYDESCPVADERGDPDGFQGFFYDITARKAAEASAREQQEHLRTVLSGMPIMLDAFDDGLRLALWNAECERVTGYPAAELLGRDDVMERLYPDAQQREAMYDELRCRGGDYRGWELPLTRKDGEQRIISWSNVSASLPVPG